MPENLDSEQSRRLWEHRLHIENLLYSRLNFFLIFESVLLGVVGALYSKTGQSTLVLKVIVLLGFCITVVWVYVQHNVKQLRWGSVALLVIQGNERNLPQEVLPIKANR